MNYPPVEDADQEGQDALMGSSHAEMQENLTQENEIPLPHKPEEMVIASTSSQSDPPPKDTELDPQLLLALGEATSDKEEFGPNVHESLAKLWLPILRKGLLKETKDTIRKSYLTPENCKLLAAPKLNAEISAAVTEVVRGRDKKIMNFQQQLGTGVTAINKGMDVLLRTDNKVEALKYLSDSCRILSDLHFTLGKHRMKLIMPSLDKNFLHVLQDSERDDTLYGAQLSEKIKASKAIEKQGQQIKKNVTVQRPPLQSTVARPAHPGNWSAPPRYPSVTRGGRGGARRPPQVPSRRPPATAALNKQPPHARS